MKRFIKGRIDVLKSIPLYGWILAIILFVLQYSLYLLAKLIINLSGGISRCIIPIIPFDDQIPLIPFFIIIYVFTYAFWFFGFLAPSLVKNKEEYLDWLIGILTAYIIGFIIFCAFPTYMDRAADKWIIAAQGKQGIFYDLWRFIIANDGGDINLNLFPSYHCLISLYVYFGVHNKKNFSLSFRIYSLIMVILICLSTVFTKQHYLVDIFGGLGVALLVYILICIIKPGKKILYYKNKKQAELNKKE